MLNDNNFSVNHMKVSLSLIISLMIAIDFTFLTSRLRKVTCLYVTKNKSTQHGCIKNLNYYDRLRFHLDYTTTQEKSTFTQI
jgi:hypothetical protein